MKKNKKATIILTVLFALTSICTHAQHLINVNDFWKGEIKTTGGQIIKGFVRVPDEGDDKSVAYIISKDDKKKEIDSEEIESIIILSETGKTYTFDRLATRYNFRKENTSNTKMFLMIFNQESHATFYIASTGYSTNKKTGDIDIVSSFVETKDLPTFTYLIRKKGQTFADVLAQTSPSPTMFGLNKALKVRSEYLLADDPDLVKRIQNGEFTHKDIPAIIDIYQADKGKK